MGLAGSGIGISNFRLRFLLLIFLVIAVLGVVLFFRQQKLKSAESLKEHNNTVVQDLNVNDPDTLKSSNYQVEVQDTSPAAQ